MEEEEEWEVGRMGRGEGKKYEGWADVEGGIYDVVPCVEADEMR